jgi:hypothetical protein
MYNSTALRFCAFLCCVVSIAWGGAPVDASCADGRPEQRQTCAYKSIVLTITNEAAKADSLLIKDAPALARRLTRSCLATEQSAAKAPEQCWLSAAAGARRFTQGVTGLAAEELRALSAVWSDLAQRLQQEQKQVAAQAAEAPAIEPVSEDLELKNFSSRKVRSKPKKRKLATKSRKRRQNAVVNESRLKTSSRSPRRRKSQLKTTFAKKRYGLAWNKNMNINKVRAKNNRPLAMTPNRNCTFSIKLCQK